MFNVYLNWSCATVAFGVPTLNRWVCKQISVCTYVEIKSSVMQLIYFLRLKVKKNYIINVFKVINLSVKINIQIQFFYLKDSTRFYPLGFYISPILVKLLYPHYRWFTIVSFQPFTAQKAVHPKNHHHKIYTHIVSQSATT